MFAEALASVGVTFVGKLRPLSRYEVLVRMERRRPSHVGVPGPRSVNRLMNYVSPL